MPQLQVLDSGEADVSPLTKTLQGFMKRETEHKENDALKDIYKKYKDESQTLSEVLMNIQTEPNLSPTRRVESAKSIVEMQKYNKQLQEDTFKQFKEQQVQQRAEEAANRSERAEKRLTEDQIAKQYNTQIKELDDDIESTSTPFKEKEALRRQRNELREQRKKALADYRAKNRAGESGLAAQAEPITIPQQQENPVIVALTKTFPPDQFKGKSKWDKQGNEYKSDGTKWVQVAK